MALAEGLTVKVIDDYIAVASSIEAVGPSGRLGGREWGEQAVGGRGGRVTSGFERGPVVRRILPPRLFVASSA